MPGIVRCNSLKRVPPSRKALITGASISDQWRKGRRPGSSKQRYILLMNNHVLLLFLSSNFFYHLLKGNH